jgi:Fe-S-cluster containining protein
MFEVKDIHNNRFAQEYFKAHNCKIEGNKVLVPYKCPHLTDDNLCDIHEKKPFLCKQFRGKSQGKFYVPKTCGFRR